MQGLVEKEGSCSQSKRRPRRHGLERLVERGEVPTSVRVYVVCEIVRRLIVRRRGCRIDLDLRKLLLRQRQDHRHGTTHPHGLNPQGRFEVIDEARHGVKRGVVTEVVPERRFVPILKPLPDMGRQDFRGNGDALDVAACGDGVAESPIDVLRQGA